MSADQPCTACGSTEADCMSSQASCCDVCAVVAGFTHEAPGDQMQCPEADNHDDMVACPFCSYASRRTDAGR